MDDVKQRVLRAQSMAGRLPEHIDRRLGSLYGSVAFVSGSCAFSRLEGAPLDVGSILQAGIWSKRTAVLTSATIPSALTESVGILPDTVDQLDVGSPFFFSSRRRHTSFDCDWSSDVCSSDLPS